MLRSVRDEIVEVVNKLFVFTDNQNWDGLRMEVFTNQVEFDMSSLGGVKATLTSAEICEMWETGFIGVDHINHLAGNYIIHIDDNTANVLAYATATHYKESATLGKTREFVGTYDIGLINEGSDWRIWQFKYNVKFITGNADLI